MDDSSKFIEASVMLIDDHMDWLKSERAREIHNNLGGTYFEWEFRTLSISGRRQAGHTQLATKLAFDVGNDVGLKYSVIIIAPTMDRMHSCYRPDNIYFDPESSIDQLKQCIADEYAIELETIMRSHKQNYGGKVLAASSICSTGFSAKQFCDRQRNAIFEMTGEKIDKINLCIIDGWSALKQEQQDRIHAMFADDVDLFVQLQ